MRIHSLNLVKPNNILLFEIDKGSNVPERSVFLVEKTSSEKNTRDLYGIWIHENDTKHNVKISFSSVACEEDGRFIIQNEKVLISKLNLDLKTFSVDFEMISRESFIILYNQQNDKRIVIKFGGNMYGSISTG